MQFERLDLALDGGLGIYFTLFCSLIVSIFTKRMGFTSEKGMDIFERLAARASGGVRSSGGPKAKVEVWLWMWWQLLLGTCSNGRAITAT